MKQQLTSPGWAINLMGLEMPTSAFIEDVDGQIPKLITTTTTTTDTSASAIASSAQSSNEATSPATPDLPGPPANFAEVCPGVYRSSFPKANSLDFLAGLGLKTVLTLVSDAPYPPANEAFMLANDIAHVQIPLPPNKVSFDAIPPASMRRALRLLADPCRRPLLVHCNKGKHRTGCLVACFRKVVLRWPLAAVIDEYRAFAGHKARPLDEKYIELYHDDDENGEDTARAAIAVTPLTTRSADAVSVLSSAGTAARSKEIIPRQCTHSV